MLLVDYRSGSEELIAPLQKAGLPATKDDLPEGDLAWIGRGEKGEPVWIGIEFKKVAELMQALRTNRVNEQARRMAKSFRYRYLLIEGDMHMDEQGRMLRRAKWGDWKPLPGLSAAELFKRVYVLHLTYGLTPIFVPSRYMTIKQIGFLYRVWTDQDLDKHKSHLGIYEPPTLVEPSAFVRTVRSYPGCGIKLALAAEDQFGTIRRATNATAAEWAALETTDDHGKTRRFGAANAAKILTHLTTGGTHVRSHR